MVITDKKILRAIGNIRDKEVRKIFGNTKDETSGVYVYGHTQKQERSFMREHESAFRALYPVCYERVLTQYEKYFCSIGWELDGFFVSWLCIECGVVDWRDFTTAENIDAAGLIEYDCRDKDICAVHASYFARGLNEGAFTVPDLLAYLQKNPVRLGYFLPLLASYPDERLWQALVEYVKTAKTEDSLRAYCLRAMCTAENAKALVYFADAIDNNNFYRLRAMNDVPMLIDEYSVPLPPKEIVRIMRDAAAFAVDKYLKASFAHAVFFITTVDRLVPEEVFFGYARRFMREGALRVRQALTYVLSSESVSGEFSREVFCADRKLTADDLSFFIGGVICELLPPDVLSVTFETAFNVLTTMGKVNEHFKTDDEIPFARDLHKSTLVVFATRIARRVSLREYFCRLDAIYDSLREEAQAAYLETAGEYTKLDRRACAIRFLKTDNYQALRYYEEQKIVLTYNEAIVVSDFLKSKKESVKNKILKEFLASPDSEKIADYLCAASEEYKVAAGREMKESAGKVSRDALQKPTNSLSWYNVQNVFRVPSPDKEISEKASMRLNNKLPPPPSCKRIKNLTDKLTAFIEEHKAYEYKTAYDYDGLVTLGSRFAPVTLPARTFDCYPFGQELEKIISSSLTEDELLGLILLLYCIDRHKPEQVVTIYGKKNDALAHLQSFGSLYGTVTAVSLLHCLNNLILRELVSPSHRAALLSVFARKEVIPFVKDSKPYNFIYAAEQDDDPETLDTLAHVLCVWLSHGIKNCYYTTATEKLLTGGRISPELAEYIVLSDGESLDYLFDPSSPSYILRNDYAYPVFKEFMCAFVQKGLNAEFSRGSLATPYSESIRRIGHFYGVEIFARAIASLRGLTWVRSPYGCERNAVLSHVLKSAQPCETDTYESFVAYMETYAVTDDELLRATVFNPAFAEYAQKYLGVPQLNLAVYWFVAHLNETLEGKEREKREEKLKEFSDISYPDFQDGAFDYKWYEEMVRNVPADIVRRIYENAKYVTVGGLHKRAQRFFDAVNGRINKEECLEKIKGTRNKDYCLIYSLVPVVGREDLRERYLVYNTFLHESRKYGAQRQLSERRTVDIALENLARAAGYADTNIFVFEMEADNPSDIYQTVTVGEIEITPYIDQKNCKIAYRVEKAGKTLSAIPAKYVKDGAVAALREEIGTLNKKFRRVVRSLEDAMCARIPFTVPQLKSICREQIIATVIGKLVLLADGEFAVFSNGELRDINGKPCTATEVLVAHPVELKEKGLLSCAIDWVVKNNIRQPFKQALREMYGKSDEERAQEEVLRFKGFEVDVRKCVAALKGKGWGVSEDIGLRKVYYRANTVAAIFRKCDFWYIADGENPRRELHGIFFLRRNTQKVIPLQEVDEITFSETLRDVDLMITVSSDTIYDFELAKSTVEIRREILRSVSDILHLDGVSFLKDNISVKGHYGTYIVNIRTGLVFKEGKGNLLLDTVYSAPHALPLDFIDEDPMTADIISKAIVLAADEKIRDPAVLRQIMP